MTLRKKLMLSFLILVLLMGSMIGYFSYQNAKNLVLENKEQEMADTINRIDMRNVHRRIQLHFGEAYGLKIDSEWQKGTTVTILLPVEEVDQAKEVTEDENRNCR